ncbi:MAG: hypothetical protein AAFZ18_11595, partial [Myxococcota bacterium]
MGQLCLDGVCTACEASSSCEATPLYAAQDLTQCREGLCTACSPGLVGCGCVEGACTTGECVGGTCTDCTRGEPGCVCLESGDCNAGATCGTNGLCAACPVGEAMCACGPDESCGEGLVCEAGTCVADTCVDGAVDCPCGPQDTCDANLYCDAESTCRTCSSDIAGCPCDAEGQCGGDNFCNAEVAPGVCESCPAEDKPESCGCTADAQCGEGLLCDDEAFACRAPQSCDDLTCLPFQACTEATTADPAQDAFCVPETCVAGFVWDAATQSCVPLATPSCFTAGGEPTSAALACEAAGRVCVDVSGGTTCVATCETLGCGLARRSCTPGATTADDAQCGSCEPGYADDNGTCVLSGATCAGAAGIQAQCDALSRSCVDGPSGAFCGDCTDGKARDPRTGQCTEVEACGETQCFDGEFCHYAQDGRPPECRLRCPAGQAMTESGQCVSCGALSCGSGEIHGALVENQCVCEADTFCAYNSDSGPRCQTSPCPAGQARSVLGGACTQCNVTCGNSEGEGDRVWPWRNQIGNCFCETQDDYFMPTGGTRQATACDADGDGWINFIAENAYQSAQQGPSGGPDAAVLANFRCARREVDRIRLVNEYGQRRDVGLCGSDGVVRDWAPGDLPTECAAGPISVTLAESAELESDNAIGSEDTVFPALGGRKLRAAELNMLTKACVTPEADFNANMVADLAEEQVLDRARLPGSTDAELLFRAVSYFVETHTGRFLSSGSGTRPGRYIIEERSRCEADFPLTYDNAAADYWRGCTRRRESSFDTANPLASLNSFDFSQFSCDASTGSCDLLPPVTTGASADGDAVEDSDVCALRAAGLVPFAPVADDGTHPGDTPWRGMNHASQFKCARIGTGTGNQYVAASVLGGASTAPEHDFNQCSARACAGQAGCEESTKQDADRTQPSVPNIDCSFASGTGVAVDSVGFVSSRFTQATEATPYTRGCVNESAAFPQLCPGYTQNPDAVLTSANPALFGKLSCGCGAQYGGLSCEFACPVRAGAAMNGKLHFGGPIIPGLTAAEAADYGCITAPGQSGFGGYCTQFVAVPNQFVGGSRGYWMCGQPNAARPAGGGNDPSQTGQASGGGTYTLSGVVPATPVRRGLHTSTATDAC